ncbi:MAG: flagellar hook-basal body complex protein FliE [Candidatus Aenigmarchaeota archaeon]|nr:flagellar hook-basal body complex protein FliE [Candidatus Aenigmarchaeota archaeon]
MKIIATAGMPGSGKGEVLEYFKKKKIPSIVMREVVEKQMEEKNIEVNNKNLRNYATGLRDDHGSDIVARMCLPIIESMKGNDIILIDGVRGYDEVKLFKKELTDDFILIGVFAPPKQRFERLCQRGRKWDMKTLEEFEWRDSVELSWGLGNAIALSDFMVENTGTLEELHMQLDKILEKIR